MRNDDSKRSSKIWFIRHGESHGNLGDKNKVHHNTELTETGQEEARQTANQLIEEGVSDPLILTSPLERCVATAEIIAGVVGGQVIIEEDLHERRWGELSDRYWQDLASHLDAIGLDERYKFVPEGGESWEQMEDRLAGVVNSVTTNSSSENRKEVIIVTHRGCLRAILPKLSGLGIHTHEEYSIETGGLIPYSPDDGSLGEVKNIKK
jgi:broad specificity phosphatase PhoE